MSMIQVGIIGVIGAVLAIQLKSGKSEYGIYVSVAVSIVLFSFIVDRSLPISIWMPATLPPC